MIGMKDFEEVLEKAQLGDRQAMEELILEYLPLINGLVEEKLRKILWHLLLVFPF